MRFNETTARMTVKGRTWSCSWSVTPYALGLGGDGGSRRELAAQDRFEDQEAPFE